MENFFVMAFKDLACVLIGDSLGLPLLSATTSLELQCGFTVFFCVSSRNVNDKRGS
jgi:hypothetical protein